MTKPEQSPLLLDSYETLVWILNHVRKYPKEQRFQLAQKMGDCAVEFHELLMSARRTRKRARFLAKADFELEKLRLYNRLSKDVKAHSMNQYEFLAGPLEEAGRLLRGCLCCAGAPGGSCTLLDVRPAPMLGFLPAVRDDGGLLWVDWHHCA